jgi:hypothetical protein
MPPAWILEVVARKGRAPIVEHADDEFSVENVLLHRGFRQIGEAQIRQHLVHPQCEVVKPRCPSTRIFILQPRFSNSQGVYSATRRQLNIDTIVRREVPRFLRLCLV